MGFRNGFSGGAVSLSDSPLNYGLSSGGGTNLLAGMGITNEEYNRMFMDILGDGNGSTFESTKRQRDADEGDERGGKRSRFEVLA
jgi:hypothetical protein